MGLRNGIAEPRSGKVRPRSWRRLTALVRAEKVRAENSVRWSRRDRSIIEPDRREFCRPSGACSDQRGNPKAYALGWNLSRLRRSAAREISGLEGFFGTVGQQGGLLTAGREMTVGTAEE